MTMTFTTNGGYGYEECSEEDMNLFALRLDTENSFDFSSQSLPSSCPSTSGSFSSTSSIYDDPFTPTSRTSSPQQHIHFGGSFEDDSMLDFTPPPSATSGYFPQDLKTTVAPDMLTYHGLPSTPSRCTNMFDNPLSSHGGLDFTPTRDLELYNFDNGLGCPPFLVPSSVAQFDNSTPTFDIGSILGQHGESSPITFSSPSMNFMTPDSSPSNSPYGRNRRRVAMDGPQLRSTMLQMQTMDLMTDEDFMTDVDAQQQQAHLESTFGRVLKDTNKNRASKPKATAGRSGVRSHASYRVSKASNDSKKTKVNVGVEQRATHACDQCPRSYLRAEHLKRHKAEHLPDQEVFICHFCPTPKRFGKNRKDNYKDHLKRHCSTSPNRRTKTHPGAHALLAKFESEARPRGKKLRDSERENDVLQHLADGRAVKTEVMKAEAIKTEKFF